MDFSMCTKHTVVCPLEMLNGEAENNTIHLTWESSYYPTDFVTGYAISCTPLIEGIPRPEVQNLPPNETSTSVSGHNGVGYTCEVITRTVQGTTPGCIVNITTLESGLLECHAFCFHFILIVDMHK